MNPQRVFHGRVFASLQFRSLEPTACFRITATIAAPDTFKLSAGPIVLSSSTAAAAEGLPSHKYPQRAAYSRGELSIGVWPSLTCESQSVLSFRSQMSLFQAAAAQRSLASGPKPLVSFRCGLINSENIPGDSTKLRMRADPRKGELRLMRSFDGVLTLEWRDRTTGNPIHSWMVFPGDITFRRVKTGRESDRVYGLQFTAAGDSRRFFFWMQKGETPAAAPTEGAAAPAAAAAGSTASSLQAEDDANAKKLVELINNPQAAQAAAAANAGGGAAAGGAAGAGGGRAGRGAAAGAAPAGGALTQEQLAAMLSAMVRFDSGW
jgi:Proteasome complex subunit Rpn13 ubiquitin receptor